MIRRARPADAPAVHALRVANRAYLERWEPDDEPADRRYEPAYARDWTARRHRYVILDGETIAGCLSLTGGDLPALSSAMVGYWVGEAFAGRGLASRAVADAVELAFGELGLHRLEAGTAVENLASQRVLERNRFTRVGVLRKHLRLGGEWRDHVLWERLADD